MQPKSRNIKIGKKKHFIWQTGWRIVVELCMSPLCPGWFSSWWWLGLISWRAPHVYRAGGVGADKWGVLGLWNLMWSLLCVAGGPQQNTECFPSFHLRILEVCLDLLTPTAACSETVGVCHKKPQTFDGAERRLWGPRVGQDVVSDVCEAADERLVLRFVTSCWHIHWAFHDWNPSLKDLKTSSIYVHIRMSIIHPFSRPAGSLSASRFGGVFPAAVEWRRGSPGQVPCLSQGQRCLSVSFFF